MKPTPSIAFILLIVTSTACVSKSVLLTETDRRQSCEAQLQDTRDELRTCRNESEDLLGEKSRLLEINDNLLEDNAGLLSEKNELSTTLDHSRQELNKLTGTYDGLISSLESEIEKGQVEITQLQDRLTVRLTDKVLFDTGRADLNQKGEEVLRKVGKTLALVENKSIMVEGHTDDLAIGGALKKRYPTNWELSTARASMIVRFLQDNTAIDPANLVAAGCSEYRPVASNEFAEGRRMNRRIEIKLLPRD